MGVTFLKAKKRWIAQGNAQGKRNRLGSFKTREEAQAAYDAFRAANPVTVIKGPLDAGIPYKDRPLVIREAFDYVDGKLLWKVSFGSTKAGSEVGRVHSSGYRTAWAFGTHMGVHRLVFAWHHGRWAEDLIDHINRNPLDNRIENLREANKQQNATNSTTKRATRTGVKGVYPVATGGYKAMIRVNDELHYLGFFLTIEEAAAAYAEAKRTYHPFAADYQQEAA